jgi:hypothetical protein
VTEKTFSIITTHYGPEFWAKFLINQLHEYREIVEIIVGQNSSKTEITSGLTTKFTAEPKHLKVKVVSTKTRGRNHASYQHTQLLNTILTQQQLMGDIIVIFDSDCFPIKKSWIKTVENLLETNHALLSLNRLCRFDVHVCFIAFKRELLPHIQINFEDHTTICDGRPYNLRRETGSDLAFQLLRKQLKVYLLKPEEIMGGKLGDSYLNKQIVHMGSQSFVNKRNTDEKYNESLNYIKFHLPRKFAEMLVKEPNTLNKRFIPTILRLFLRGQIPPNVFIEYFQLKVVKALQYHKPTRSVQ